MSNSKSKSPFENVPKEEIKLCEFLLSSKAALKTTEGYLEGHRVKYFKGKSLLNAIMRNQQLYSNVKSIEDANLLVAPLFNSGLFVRVEKNNARVLSLAKAPSFDPESFYIWIYQGSQLGSQLMGILVLLLVFGLCLFPLWDQRIRTGVYYLSLGLMFLMVGFFALGAFRWVLWFFLVITTGRGGFLYPNLFADCGVLESFVPVWAWDEKKVKKVKETKKE